MYLPTVAPSLATIMSADVKSTVFSLSPGLTTAWIPLASLALVLPSYSNDTSLLSTVVIAGVIVMVPTTLARSSAVSW